MPTVCRSHQTNRSYCFLAGVFALCLGALAMPHAEAQTIHQLAYNNSTWIDQDLSSQTTDPHTGVAAFVTTPNDQIHTFYLDSAEDVHQLFFNGTSWSDEDLTAEGFGVRAMAKSAVAGFSESNLQYVYYVSQNQHVHQLFYNNADWADADITSLSGGPLTTKTPRLTALATGSSGFHVYYLASNGHVNQLYNVSGSWVNQDITKVAKGPSGRAVWIASINVGNLQYVYYLATTGHGGRQAGAAMESATGGAACPRVGARTSQPRHAGGGAQTRRYLLAVDKSGQAFQSARAAGSANTKSCLRRKNFEPNGDRPAVPRQLGDWAEEFRLPMLLTVCIEAGRKTLTHTSWTGLAPGSRKWMSGQAAALAALNDRWPFANSTASSSASRALLFQVQGDLRLLLTFTYHGCPG
jgi:hypothetical protein